MRTTTLLFAGLFFAMLTTNAQRITYGVGAGLSHYKVSGPIAAGLDDVVNLTGGLVTTAAVSGVYAGGFANIAISNHWSVEPGLYYTSKGYQLGGSYTLKNIPLLSTGASTQLRVNYIDMPVLIKANYNGLQVFAGPQLSYRTHASLHTRASIVGFNLYNHKTDVSALFNPLDVALTGGVGYQFANGLRLTAAYERGLTNIDASRAVSSYHQGVKLGAAVSF
jgi:hypothetical protein